MASTYKLAVEALLEWLDRAPPQQVWTDADWTAWEERLTALRSATYDDVVQLVDEQLEQAEV